MRFQSSRSFGLISIVIASITCSGIGQDERTIGVTFIEEDIQPGYTLFSPQNGMRNAYLLDELGRVVQSWSSEYAPGLSTYLLETGQLLRTGNPGINDTISGGGAGGQIERYSWDGELEWSFRYSTDLYRAHHDIEPLANGNILVIAWEYKTAEEALAVGRLPGTLPDALFPERIVEIEPIGTDEAEVVWEWHVWDHLIQDTDPSLPNYGNPADHPGRIDINFRANNSADWLHCNGIDYNPELDQIVLGLRAVDEIWVIDHNTTTEEAAGEAGDLLWRWGNPLAYGRGTVEDQKLFGQHDAKWIRPGMPGEGDITIFNNGNGRPGMQYSSIEQVTPPLMPDGTYMIEDGEPWGPTDVTWSYSSDPPGEFYAARISGAQRQPNGNTLICQGTLGRFFEVDANGNLKWNYINPLTGDGPLHQGDPPPGGGSGASANRVFRAERYAPDFPGFAGRDMTPGDYLEIYPVCSGDVNNDRVVNGSDLTIVLGYWGTTNALADLDGSGQVDGGDLTVVLAHWGFCQDI